MNRLQPIKTAIPLELQAGSRLTAALLDWRCSCWQATCGGTTRGLASNDVPAGLYNLDSTLQGPSYATGPSIFLLILLISLGIVFMHNQISIGLSRIVNTGIYFYHFISGRHNGVYYARPSTSSASWLTAAMNQTMAMLVSFFNPGPQPVNSFSWYYAGSIILSGLRQ